MTEWLPEEEIYLHSILRACETLSNAYLENHRHWRRIETRMKIPMIIVGSFTGITSFGSNTFPSMIKKWIPISVGIISMGIAIMNTIESYFRVGDNSTSSHNTANAFQQLREDINKELSIPTQDRQAAGITFVRDIYTRYQQILSQAPLLDEGDMKYVEEVTQQKLKVLRKRNMKDLLHEEFEIEKEYEDKLTKKKTTLLEPLTKFKHLSFALRETPKLRDNVLYETPEIIPITEE